MRLYHYLSVVLLSAAMLPQFGCSGQHTVKTQLEPGSRFARKVHVISDMLLPIRIKNADHKETDMVLDYAVKKVEPDGTANIEITIASIRAMMDSINVKFEYDSDSDTGPTKDTDKRAGQRKKFRQSFTGLVGSKYTAKIDRHGNVTELTDMDEQIEQARDGKVYGTFGGDQIAMILTEANLRQFAAPETIAQFTKNADKKDPPQIIFPIEVPRARPVKARKIYRQTEEDDKFAVIHYKIRQEGKTIEQWNKDQTQKNAKEKYGLHVVGIMGEGQVKLHRQNGQLELLEEKMKVEVKAGQSQPTKSETNAPKRKNKIFYLVRKTIEHMGK